MNKIKAFSLIELMVAVAIIGILSAIAYPSYTEYVIKSNRENVKSQMLDVSSKLASYKLLNHQFDNVTLTTLGYASSYPSESPQYDLALQASSQTWTLTATPKTGTKQQGDGIITLNNYAQKCWQKGSATCAATSSTAW